MAINLLSFQRNKTSQNGEDGIIAKIVELLGIRHGMFVEFGAWDGKHLSNTYSLLEEGWNGVYIEGDAEKYKDLLKTQEKFPNQIRSICAYVRPEGENRLDQLLKSVGLSGPFDLLSIDIDSCDWQVWHSLQEFQPKIVVIEGNTEILPGVWQVHQEGVCQGSSFTALVELGERKGYKLVCHTGNLIFVITSLADRLGLDPIHLEFPHTLFNYARHHEELAYQLKLRESSESGQTLLGRVVSKVLRAFSGKKSG